MEGCGAGLGQVSAPAVPVPARAAGIRWGAGPRRRGGRRRPRLAASAWGALFGEAGERGAGPLG